MLNNKWTGGQVHFELPPLPAPLLTAHGAKVVPLTISASVGAEMVLLITEPGNRVSEFRDKKMTRFMLKCGLVNTPFGPVFWLIFYFPHPSTGQNTVYENTLNPHDAGMLGSYQALANQRYWHVVLADDSGEVVNFFEFENCYALDDTLAQVQQVCAGLPAGDFARAKADYESRYDVDSLLAM